MRSKKKLIAAASSVCFAAMMSTTAYASGDVAGAVQSTWSTARSQVVSVVNNVVFPVIDVKLCTLVSAVVTAVVVCAVGGEIVPQAVIIIAIAAENIAEYIFFIHKFSFLND